jgi:S-adenosylmethionine synthetase
MQRGAKEVVVKLAYAIGVADPVMAIAEVDGVEEELPVKESCTPKMMIELLDLRKPQFEKTAQWGHFGNGFTWDK